MIVMVMVMPGMSVAAGLCRHDGGRNPGKELAHGLGGYFIGGEMDIDAVACEPLLQSGTGPGGDQRASLRQRMARRWIDFVQHRIERQLDFTDLGSGVRIEKLETAATADMAGNRAPILAGDGDGAIWDYAHLCDGLSF